MKKFVIKTKCGEKISLIKADNINQAIKIFSIVKNINVIDLTNIYNIEKI